MLNSPFSPWPCFGADEIAAAGAILASGRVNYWTGEEGRKFENEFATFAETSHAVAVANGTLALDLALLGCGIGPGDEVIVTPRTFIASVSAVVNAGATPVFADVDLDSGNLSPATIEPLLSSRTRAIVPVHLGGWPCDMPGIMQIADAHGLAVIEDCAQAHGARIDDRSVGSFGTAGAWSFCQDKIMTTGGEGGIVTTADEALWRRMWSYKDHGKDWDAVYKRDHAPGFRWVHESIGTNWRMLEIQAVIGRLQLGKLASWHARRAAIAARYEGHMKGLEDILRIPLPGDNMRHAFYRFYAYVRPDGLKNGWSRDRIIAEATARGGLVQHGTCPEVYREKAFDGTPWRPAQRLPNAAALGETACMFLTHPTLSDDEVDRIASIFVDVARQAKR